jgi:Protein of unknown function (DUF1569)
MENIFEPSVAENIISRIGKLQAGTVPLWGKMNAAQMMAHCQVPIKVGLGEANIKQSFIGFLFGRMAKKAFLKDIPFKKNLPTDKSFIMADEKDFELEKQQLTNLIRRFGDKESASILNTRVHPFFGKMTVNEWGLLSWKHLDHHLQQFGV